jgi:hypothetical protein
VSGKKKRGRDSGEGGWKTKTQPTKKGAKRRTRKKGWLGLGLGKTDETKGRNE